MASLNTSTGDVQIQFKESESRQYVNENEQASDGKKNGDIYDEPANIDENGRKTNNKQLQQSNSFVRCLMILVVVLVVIVALMAVSTISNIGFSRSDEIQFKIHHNMLQNNSVC